MVSPGGPAEDGNAPRGGSGAAREGGAVPGDGGLGAIRAAFSGKRGPEPDRSLAPVGISAVLIAAFEEADGSASLLYTQRSPFLRRHPGEVSFPGGRVDPTDLDPLAAALREADEEVGLAPSEVEVVGHLTDYLTFHDVLVCAYVGVVAGRAPPREPRSREEVARVFTVPVSRLLDGSCYECRRLPDMPAGRVVHYWHVEPQTMWGVTGELTARFLRRVYDWRPPREARVVREPSEFRPER